MNQKYMGETPLQIEDSIFKDFTPTEIALYVISLYGQISGDHHKTWTLDQAARALHGGTFTELCTARWEIEGQEDLIEVRWTEISKTPEYEAWVTEMKGEFDEENECFEYDYDTGIAP